MQATELAPFVPVPIDGAPTIRVYGPDDILLDWSTTSNALGTANWFAAQYAHEFVHIDLVQADGKHTVIVAASGREGK